MARRTEFDVLNIFRGVSRFHHQFFSDKSIIYCYDLLKNVCVDNSSLSFFVKLNNFKWVMFYFGADSRKEEVVENCSSHKNGQNDVLRKQPCLKSVTLNVRVHRFEFRDYGASPCCLAKYFNLCIAFSIHRFMTWTYHQTNSSFLFFSRWHPKSTAQTPS